MRKNDSGLRVKTSGLVLAIALAFLVSSCATMEMSRVNMPTHNNALQHVTQKIPTADELGIGMKFNPTTDGSIACGIAGVKKDKIYSDTTHFTYDKIRFYAMDDMGRTRLFVCGGYYKNLFGRGRHKYKLEVPCASEQDAQKLMQALYTLGAREYEM